MAERVVIVGGGFPGLVDLAFYAHRLSGRIRQ